MLLAFVFVVGLLQVVVPSLLFAVSFCGSPFSLGVAAREYKGKHREQKHFVCDVRLDWIV